MEEIVYNGKIGSVAWQGIKFLEGEEFHGFLTNEVSIRLTDEETKDELTHHLRGLASTGFEKENLESILTADMPEERDWAIGEAIAEVWLSGRHGVVWPWNMERDKRTPKASLPGADLVGFVETENRVHFAFGEVKSSSHPNTPPNVMYGKSGMTRQLESLATDTALLYQLIKWLWPRCRTGSFSKKFDDAVKTLIASENKALYLFGVLLRDTQANNLDVISRASGLSEITTAPMNCSLTALYLPCRIRDLPSRMAGRE
tara:strand:- start:3365 stop:4141 length:777 start_codon:yes stop_codon:yes gene_type:complete